MDGQDQQAAGQHQAASPQPTKPVTPVPAAAQSGKPKLHVSDQEAQAILAINNLTLDRLQNSNRPKNKPPMKIIIAVVSLVILAIIVSLLIGSAKPAASNTTNSGVSSQSEPSNNNDVTNQINQDVKSCSNPATAISEC